MCWYFKGTANAPDEEETSDFWVSVCREAVTLSQQPRYRHKNDAPFIQTVVLISENIADGEGHNGRYLRKSQSIGRVMQLDAKLKSDDQS